MIEAEIQELLKSLREEQRHHLASVIEKNWNKTVLDYSASLFKYSPVNSVEPELLNAIRTVLLRYNYSQTDTDSILQSFIKYRVVQTAHHVDICNTPRMYTINWLTTRGLPQNAWYLVFAFSGIPFGNASRPGCIKYSNHSLDQVINSDSNLYPILKKDLENSKNDREHSLMRISLVPSSMQDEIVYGSKITEKTIEVANSLSFELKEKFNTPILDQDYSSFALNTSCNIEKELLQINKSCYLDINEISKEYLLQILKNKDHIVTKILCNNEVRSILAPVIPTEAIFYNTYKNNDGRLKQESIFLNKDGFSDNKLNLKPNADEIVKALVEDRLCPGLFLTYLIFMFVNGVRTLGSFVAAEYLPIYKEKLIATGIMKEYNLENIPEDNLTTGMLPDLELEQITSIDILLGTKWKPDPNMLYGELLVTLMSVLYGRDFTK